MLSVPPVFFLLFLSSTSKLQDAHQMHFSRSLNAAGRASGRISSILSTISAFPSVNPAAAGSPPLLELRSLTEKRSLTAETLSRNPCLLMHCLSTMEYYSSPSGCAASYRVHDSDYQSFARLMDPWTTCYFVEWAEWQLSRSKEVREEEAALSRRSCGDPPAYIRGSITGCMPKTCSLDSISPSLYLILLENVLKAGRLDDGLTMVSQMVSKKASERSGI